MPDPTECRRCTIHFGPKYISAAGYCFQCHDDLALPYVWNPLAVPDPEIAGATFGKTIKFCGVLVRWGRPDKPCVLEPGHDGPCRFSKRGDRT